MAIAAIDYGRRRFGIAASDAAGLLVYPAGVIERQSLKRDLATLAARLRELEASRVILGWPLNMDGNPGSAARAAERFAQELRNATGLEVELYDERLSTFEAEERLRTVSKRGHRATMVDSVAAVVILEGWLEAQRRSR
jgi:putative holliday junction resolvase